MKKILIAGFIGLSMISYAQVTRFVYQASMKLSKEKEDRSNETVYLEVSPEKSLFFSENRVKRDSVMQRMRQTRSFDRSAMENLRSTINYTVEKDILNQTVIYSDRIGRDNYLYTEQPNFEWKILPETVTIGEYKTQKAEGTYGGRTWYAWFSSQLPYQDGPYKFSGLPGLIVKLEDDKGEYSFDLKETKKIGEFTTLETSGFGPGGGQKVKITKEKFNQQLKNYQKDPVGYMSTGMRGPGGGGPRMGGMQGGGPGGNNPNQRSDMEQRLLEEEKSNNNPIELK